MPRLLAFIAAILISTLTVVSACIAAASDPVRFTLEPARSSGDIRVSFRKRDGKENGNDWSTNFKAGELAGLDIARLRAAGSSPLRFAIVREAGRLDCAGHGGNAMAVGTCSFQADAGFMQFLLSRGMWRPSEEQAFALVAVDARRATVEALSAARYPAPTVDNLIALTALGVSGRYIADLARVGYRPATLDTLLQFKALDVTPAFIQGFVRLGYGNLPGDELVQLKALGVTSDYVAGFERLGYRRLPIAKLVEMKALGITPDYVRAVQRSSGELPSPDRLAQLRAIGFRPRLPAR